MKRAHDADRPPGGFKSPSRDDFEELHEDEIEDEYGSDYEDDADDHRDHAEMNPSAASPPPTRIPDGAADGSKPDAADLKVPEYDVPEYDVPEYDVPEYDVPELYPTQPIQTDGQADIQRMGMPVPADGKRIGAGEQVSPAPNVTPRRPRRFKLSGRTLIWGALAVLLLAVGARYALGSAGKPAANESPSAAQTPKPATTPTPNVPSASGITGPIVLMNPGMAKPGDQITVSGYSFGKQGTVDLYFKQQANGPGQAIGYVRTDQTGSFSTAFNLPQSATAGPFTLEVRQRGGKQVATANGSVNAGVAFVKMGAVVGKVGQTIGWSGNGFVPGETINVYWNALGTQPMATFHADGGGAIKATVQVPFAAAGWNSFIFMGTRSQSPVTTSFLVLKLYPTVKPSSYALKADNPITFSGSGFGPNERVLIFLNSMGGAPMAIAQANNNGSFGNAGTMVIPFTFKGKQTIWFLGEQSRQPTSITFTVLPYLPHAQASTYGGLPGTTISFYAFDFAKNEVVHVYTGRSSGGGGTLVACFRTNDKGDAGAQGSYTIPANAQGKLTFTLIGANSGASTTAVVTVSPSTVPIQVPPQQPFTCPLDQANQTSPQTPGAAAGGAAAGGAANPGNQAPQAPQTQPQAPAGGAAPAGQQPAVQPQQPAGGADNGAQGAQPQAPAATNPGGSAAPAPGDQQLPQTAPGAATPGAQAPGGTTGGDNTNTTNNPQGSLDSPSRAADLSLVATVLTMPMVSQAATDRTGLPPVSPSPVSAAGQERTADMAQIAVSSHAVAIVGLLWFGLVVTLLLLTVVRARVLPRKDADAPDTAGEREEQPDGRPSGVRLPWRRHAQRSVGQLVPVVVPGGARLQVPEIAGITARGRSSGEKSQEVSVLLQVGPPAGSLGQQVYALLAMATDIGGSSPSGYTSAWATQTIGRYIARGMEYTQPVSPTALLTQALASIHNELRERNQRHHTSQGVTVTAALLVGGLVHIVSIGDSRAYLFNPIAGLRQITTDHSLVAALVTNKLLAPDALYTHPRRGYIYRCLGLTAQSRVDAFQAAMRPDDRLVLCSEALWQAVRDPTIETILQATSDSQQAAERMLSMALEGGEKSRLAVIVARTLASTPALDLHPLATKPTGQGERFDPHSIAT